MRRVVSAHALVGALLLLAQLGGGTPLPSVPAAPGERSPDVWVPDRYLVDPVRGGTSFVPGHWERRLSDREYYAPSSPACNSGGGECSTGPAGVRPPPDTRSVPFDPRTTP